MSLLQVDNLITEFDTDEGRVRAVDDVSFCAESGKMLGIVGESGCGKSVTALSIMRLLPQPAGPVIIIFLPLTPDLIKYFHLSSDIINILGFKE